MTDSELEQIIEGLLREQEGSEDSIEGLGFLKKFFRKIRKKTKKIRGVLKKVVGKAAGIAGGMFGGPVGAKIGAKIAAKLNKSRRRKKLPLIRIPPQSPISLPSSDPRVIAATRDIAWQMMDDTGINMRTPRARRAFNSYIGSESKRISVMTWAVPAGIGVAVLGVVAFMTRGR